ncbi:MAG TPA: cysteine synthase family protein [Phycisphaerales bacterium]|nr:cysteine synthase family protein [Phycisphaerales bacterium]
MDLQTRVFDDVAQMLPSEANPSPMVRINRLNPLADAYSLYAKLEWMNPFGSVKDRAAARILRDLEERGEIGPARPGRTIIEPTSGNTGLSLAALAASRGIPMHAVMPSKAPIEKQVLLRLCGADLDVVDDSYTSAVELGNGPIGMARTQAAADPERRVMPDQYQNRMNTRAHAETTGPEIWRQTAGRVTHVFLALGTAGTAMGLAEFLKSKNPGVKVVAAMPDSDHDVPGVRNASELRVSGLFDRSKLDEVIELDGELAFTAAAELCRGEGLLAGPSSGLIFEAARRYLRREGERVAGGVGVCIFCDSVFKYISSMVKHLPELGVLSLES